MKTAIIVAIICYLIAEICRYYADGTLKNDKDHSCASVQPTYWQAQEKRERKELIRNIGSVAMMVACVATVLCFVKLVVGGVA